MKHLRAFVHAARCMELLGRRASKVHLLQCRGSLRGLQIDTRGLGAPARVLEDLPEALAQPVAVGRRRRERLDRQSEETCGLIECQLSGSPFGRALGELPGAHRLAGAQQMRGKRFNVDVGRGLEHAGEPAVVLAHGRAFELSDDRLADACVHGLEDLVPVAKSRAQEPARTKQRDHVVARPLDAGGLPRQRYGERTTADGDDFEQTPRLVREG